MTSKELEKLIDPTKYQVFLFSSPAPVPASFAVHPWFVVNQKGVVSRWEVIYQKNLRNRNVWGYLYMNIWPVFQGSPSILPFHAPFWKNFTLLGSVEGDEHSSTAKIAEYIVNSKNTYPYREKYFALGPNSNTFAQWVLDAFPEWKAKLPWNAIGKGYKK